MRELEGLQPFGVGLYHNAHYETLIQRLAHSRAHFRQQQALDARKAIASQEYAYW